MEAKFSQYWKVASLTFCLSATLDPRLKLVEIETLLTNININVIKLM